MPVLPLRSVRLVAAALSFLAVALPAASQSLQWDPASSNGEALGGTGTWSTAAANLSWYNGAANVVWDNLSTASFGGTTAGTVTIDNTGAGGAVQAAGLTFSTSGYTIAGSPLTLSGTPAVTVGAAATDIATVNAALAGVTPSVSGPGVLVLGGNNTFTGPLAISAGVVHVANAGALNSTTPVSVSFPASSTGTLRLNGNNVTIASLTASSTAGGVRVENANAAPAILTIDQSTDTTFQGVIQDGTGGGALGLTKTGIGVLTLNGGVANTFTGKIVVTGGGTLSFNADNRLGATPGAAVTDQITLNNGTLRETANSITLDPNRGVTIGDSTAAGTGTIEITTTGTTGLIYAGIIANNGSGTGNLVKTGVGILRLTGPNTYTGTTTVSAGSLRVGNNAALGGTAAGTTVTSGAQVQIGGTVTVAEPLTLNGTGVTNDGALLNIANSNTWSGAITLGSGGARINSNTGTLTVSTGGISGTGQPLTVGGTAGSVTISGAITTGSGGTIAQDFASATSVLTLSSASNNFAAASTGSTVITITGGILSQGGESSSTAGTPSFTGVLPSAVTPSFIFINGGTLRSTRTGVGVTFLATNKGITLGANGGALDVSDVTQTDLNIYSGVITGGSATGGLTKTGAGVLAITAAETYLGPTTVTGGTLRIRTTAERIPDGSALTVNSGAIFDVNGVGTETVGSLAGAGNVNLGSGTLVSGGDNSSTVFSGQFVQTAGGVGGKVTKNGTGTLTLTGNNVHSGTNTVSAGTLKLGSATALGFGGAMSAAAGTTVSSGATLDLNGTTGINNVITLNGTGVGGNGALINSNTGTAAALSNGVATGAVAATTGATSTTLTVSGGGGSGAAATASLGLTTSTFTINGGTTTYSVAPTAVVSGNGVVAATLDGTGVVNGYTVTTVGSGYTTAPTITFSGGTVITQGTNPTGTGNVNFRIVNFTITNPGSGYTSSPNFTSGTVTINPTVSSVVLATSSSIGGPGDISIAGVISGSAAATLTKVGAGTLTLIGANTYSGSTVVSAGALRVTGAGTMGSGAVSVSGTGTLGGNGTINGPVTIASGASVAPGNSIGTLNVAGMTWQPGGNYNIEHDPSSTSSDLISGTGALDLSALNAGNQFTLTLVPAGTLPATPTPQTYTIATFAGGMGVPDNSIVSTRFSFQGAFNTMPVATVINAGGSAQSVQLQFTPVPEPAFVLLACGSAGWLARRRRTAV